ncbi:MAG: DUF3575 domain-containing protein [Chitinophagaceae bacterium]
MKKCQLISLLCLWCCMQTGFAQKTTPPYENRLFARAYLPGLIDPMDANITAGLEYKLTPQWSATMDAGYVYLSTYYNVYNIHRTSGYILRPGIRWYFSSDNKWFLEAQLPYKQVTYKLQDWVNRGGINGSSAYEQFTTFRVRKYTAGVNLMGGIKRSIGRQKKVFFEFYAGFGLRYKEEGPYRTPDDMQIEESDIRSSFPSNILPSMPMGIRFGWRLN